MRKKGSLNTTKGQHPYILIYAYKIRVEEPLEGLYVDNLEDIVEAEAYLDYIRKEIEEGTFDYAREFPGATDKKKARFASPTNHNENTKKSEEASFGDYEKIYTKKVIAAFKSPSKRTSYSSKIRNRILPYFKDININKLKRQNIIDFIETFNEQP